MSQNDNIDAARQYHSGTKHSYLSVRMHPHILDWENKPLPFKIYPTLEVIRLPRDFNDSGMPALSAIASTTSSRSQTHAVPDLETLSEILFFSAGVTRSKKHHDGETFFRAAACTGALYEIDLYIVCTEIAAQIGPGISPGVYHFGPAEFGLRQLRSGDFRQVVVEATAGESAVATAPVIIIFTATYWRNAWKYHSRAYRHFGWDNGTILANLLAMCASSKLPAEIITGFKDSTINQLLGLTTEREVAFSIAALGHHQGQAAGTPELPPLDLPVVAYSREEVDYPPMRRMHDASSLDTREQIEAWRGNARFSDSTTPKEATISLQLPEESKVPKDSVTQVISRRGSTRQFARDPLTLAQLSLMLDRSTRGIPTDFVGLGDHLNDLYLIVNSVVGLAAGAYFYHWESKQLELLKSGEFRDKAGYLGLEQQIPADASVDIFFLADVKKILERYGNRGYRAVQLEAGIVGGKLYLAAYAQKLGATGLTFYDDDVVSFFSPHARGKSAIFLVALGRSMRKGTTP